MRQSLLPAFLVLAFATNSPLSAADGAANVRYFGYASAIELSNGETKAVVAGESGGRILEYSLHGRNVLYLSPAEQAWKPGEPPQSSAGRFDIGPELVVPPRQVLWSGTWTTEIAGDRHARLTSPNDPATGVRLVRDFVLDPDSSHLACTQTIVNCSEKPVEWCHWSRTFAVGRGICVIPLTAPSRFPASYVMYEEGTLINMKPEDPNIRVRDGHLEILAAPRRPKLGFDSYSGSMAYFAPNGLLFIKRFQADPDRVYNEAAGLTMSVWYPDGDMVELEPIGPRERLDPGQSAGFTEHWYLQDHEFPGPSNVDLVKLDEVLAGQPPVKP